MFTSLPHRHSQIRHFHSATSTLPPGPTRAHSHLLGLGVQLWNSAELFLWECKRLFQRKEILLQQSWRKKQFIFVLIYSLTCCRKIPVQYFNILLPVLIAWIKQSHFSLNCQTSNVFKYHYIQISLTLFKKGLPITGRNLCFVNWTKTSQRNSHCPEHLQ